MQELRSHRHATSLASTRGGRSSGVFTTRSLRPARLVFDRGKDPDYVAATSLPPQPLTAAAWPDRAAHARASASRRRRPRSRGWALAARLATLRKRAWGTSASLARGVRSGGCSAPGTTSLLVIHSPDLVIDVLSGEERRKLSLIVPAVGVEHLADAVRVRTVEAETADGARHVPVDRAAKRVLQVVPDEAAPGAKQVAQRDVPVQRLGREARFKDDRSQRGQPLAKRRDRGALLGVGRSQLAEQTLDVVAQLTRPPSSRSHSRSASCIYLSIRPSSRASSMETAEWISRSGSTLGTHSVNVIHRPSWWCRPSAIKRLGDTDKPEGIRNSSTETSRSSHLRGSS